MNINDFLMKYRRPLWDGEGEGGSNAAAGSGGDDDNGEKGGEGGEGDKSGSRNLGLLDRGKSDEGKGEKSGEGEGEKNGEGKGDPVRPEHIPEKFWDTKKGEVNTEAMVKAYGDLEKAHGELKRGGKDVPKTAEEYFPDGIDLPDEVDRLSIDGPDDPGLKAWGEICHKYGLGKEMATNLARDMFVMMNQYAPEAVDQDAEFDALGKGAQALIDGTLVWVNGLEQSGKLSGDDMDVVSELAQTANGIRFLANIREASGEERIPIIPSTGEKTMTSNQWHDAMKSAVKANDYAEQERLEELGKTINGLDPSSGGRQGGVNAELTGRKRSG